MKNKIVMCLVTVCSAACSTSSEVVPSGRDSYRIVLSQMCCDRNGFGVRQAAFEEASEFCAESGKATQVIKVKQKGMVLFRASAQADLEFRCN